MLQDPDETPILISEHLFNDKEEYLIFFFKFIIKFFLFSPKQKTFQ